MNAASVVLSGGTILGKTHPKDDDEAPMEPCTFEELTEFVNAFYQVATQWTWDLTDAELTHHFRTWAPSLVPHNLAGKGWTAIVNNSIPIGERWAIGGTLPYIHPAIVQGTETRPICAHDGNGLYGLAIVWAQRP